MVGWESFPAALVGAGFTVLIKLAYDGSKWGKKNGKPNGYVKKAEWKDNADQFRADCKSNVDQFTKSIELLHQKTNTANEGIAYIKGRMEDN